MPDPSAPPNPPEDDLLAHPLWQVEFGAGDPCIAKSGERTYLVLFTSSEGAERFIAAHPVPELPSASITLFSSDLGAFIEAARVASEKGLVGALIDPDRSGRVPLRIDFGESQEPTPTTREYR